jgi:site-specific recombinase XerD
MVEKIDSKTNYRLIDIFDAYIKHLRTRKVSRSTINIYYEKLTPFIDFCEDNGVFDVSDLTAGFLRDYILFLRETHNDGGVHISYRSIKTFFRWFEFETDEDTPIRKLKVEGSDPERLEPIPIDDVRRILEMCKTRDRAIVYFLYDTGIRATELTSLDRKQYNLLTGEVKLSETKMNEPRIVNVGHSGRKAMRNYFKERDNNNESKRIVDCPALFCNSNNARIPPHGIQEILRRACNRAGIQVWYPHSFRRSWALNCLRNGMDIYALQLIGGWKSLQILMRYLKQTEDDLRIANARYSPGDEL